ncbi:MAG: GGDEF domain-containing protein [Pseudomonadota bacterium]
MAQLAQFPTTIGDSLESLKEENDALRREMRALEIRLGELERLADSDTLTPLLNRRAFLREVSRCIARFERHGTPVIVMIADLDGLKAINDESGHQAGDAVLMHVGYTLKTQLRTIDTVARIGGDEFGMILEELDLDSAEAKARSLSASVAEDTVDGQPVSISIGYTLVRADDTLDRIMARADEAMYVRKRAQRSLR